MIKKLLPFLFFAGVFIILFYKVFFFGQVFYDGDNFHLNIPEKYFFVQQILQGHIPLWNPYLFLGIPSFADFNLGTLNPTNLLYFLFPVPRALTLLTVFDFFGLAVGMYFLLRSFLLSKTTSLFGAVVVSLSGMPFVLLGNMTFLQVIVYIPFLFLLVQKFCKEKTYTWLLFLILVQFFQLIAGHPQETYYTMFLIALYMLFFAPFPLWKRIVAIGMYGFFPLLLGSVQLFPFLEYVMHANRPVGDISYAGWGGLSFPLLPTFLFPTFYGSHLDGTWWGPQQILVGFIGIPTLFLLSIGIRFGKLRNMWFYVLSLVLSFILAFGKTSPLFYVFYFLVPGWKLFRAPAGILVFYTFFAAIIAAYGLEYLQNNSRKFFRFGKIVFWVGLVSSVTTEIGYLYAKKDEFWRNLLVYLQHHIHKHFLDALLFYDSNKLQHMFQGILWNICFVSIFVLLTGSIFWFFSGKRYQTFLLVLVTLGGFFVVNPKAILLTPISFYNTGKTIPAGLSSAIKGEYRILSLPVDLHQYRQHLPSSDFFFTEGQANLSIYQYDNNIERGVYQAGGYVTLVPESVAKFVGAKDANTNVTNIDFSHITQKQLSLMSVKYVISHEPIQNYSNIPLTLIAVKPNTYYVYENTMALERAYVLENETRIHWKTIEPTKLAFSVTSPSQAHVIVTNWYYPGWRAYVNGKEVKIASYLTTFQETAVPKGTSSVQLIYDPVSLKFGIILSLISLGLWLLCFLKFKNRQV